MIFGIVVRPYGGGEADVLYGFADAEADHGGVLGVVDGIELVTGFHRGQRNFRRGNRGFCGGIGRNDDPALARFQLAPKITRAVALFIHDGELSCSGKVFHQIVAFTGARVNGGSF